MAKFKPCYEDQLVMLPISLQNQLVPGTLEHPLSQLVDKHIDLSVFANICVHKRMNRFTLRTKLKVDVQWTRTRFALVHNIGKIHTFGTLH